MAAAPLPNTPAGLTSILQADKSGWQLVGPLGGQFGGIIQVGMLVSYCNRIVLYDNNTMTGRSPLRGPAPGNIFTNSMDFDVFEQFLPS